MLDGVRGIPFRIGTVVEQPRTTLFCHLGIQTRKIQPLWVECYSGKHTPRNLTSTGLAASRQSEPVPT